ncbi:MAG: GntR family transcriptional regulator [Janthinobacterium lividum]
MRAYEQVEATIKARLSDGSLAPGTVLLEGPIASILGVSRTPVRQALERLREEGLLSAFDGRGLVVGCGDAPVTRLDLAATLREGGSPGVRKIWAWQNTHDEVERALVRLAVLGRFRVNEAALADHLGIGRAVARDVMVRIQSSGVVAKTDKAHWVTVPLDDDRLNDLYALRQILESAAVAEAATRLPPDLVGDMLARLDAVRHSYPDASPDALDDLETDLHVTCVGHAANQELLGALLRTRCIIVSSKHLLGADAALPADDPFMDEHRAVLGAFRSLDGQAAARAMVHHLASAREKVVARLSAFRASYAESIPAFATEA